MKDYAGFDSYFDTLDPEPEIEMGKMAEAQEKGEKYVASFIVKWKCYKCGTMHSFPLDGIHGDDIFLEEILCDKCGYDFHWADCINESDLKKYMKEHPE